MHPMIETLRKTMHAKGYVVYEGKTKDGQIRPYDLNIIGIRTHCNIPNRFDDRLMVFCRDDQEREVFRSYNITTDPGLYWLQNPMNIDGTAIMCPGQYRGAYKIGKHRGYTALEQCGSIDFVRDFNRDGKLDFYSHFKEYGIIKANIHRATAGGTSKQVDKWSAGCQVFASSHDFEEFMMLCEKAREVWGNTFTYTLLTQQDMEPNAFKA